ncbi:MAG: type I 3-dehydroquinate dehydratase, partial [Lachnospiraceae bacterium]|nr:type I 3-dehydroquinate dehydratase [Lachnospiraceae bacterium]
KTEEEILGAALGAVQSVGEIAEWRADAFTGVYDIPRMIKLFASLREVLKEMPLLFTLRTRNEGGQFSGTWEEYEEILLAAADDRNTDALDMELAFGEKRLIPLIREAHGKDKAVILSFHDFEKTPSKEELKEKLERMDKAGADILKAAVMPKNSRDVLTLLSAAVEMKELVTEKPVIAISMGEEGVISRLSGEVFGSACTFGTAGSASAPGQIEAGLLRTALTTIHSSLSPEKTKKHIYLIGFMGAGKSTVAKELVKELGARLLEMDACIEEAEGKTIKEIFASEGEAYFRRREKEFLQALGRKEGAVVSCGGGVCKQKENVEVMKENGVIVLLRATPDTILSRVKDSHDRPLLNGHMNRDYIANLMEERKASYEAAAEVIIDTDGKTPEEICREIRSAVPQS